VPNGAAHLGLAPNQEARLIDEVRDRQMKRVTKIDELDHLVGRIRIE